MPVRRRRLLTLAAAAPVAGIADAAPAAEVPALSPAQVALFETPHLHGLPVPVRLDYAFRREENGKDPLEDRIWLDVRAGSEPGRLDVHPQFLTGPRAIQYPPAVGFRGNPLLLFALDRDTRELSAATGGSALWFRNRIRRALADAAETAAVEVELGDGRRVPATEFGVTPFGGEPRARRFQGRRYSFVVSAEVPGAVYAIRTALPASEGGGAVAESIVFAGASPSPGGAL